jgi:hypothetical protein
MRWWDKMVRIERREEKKMGKQSFPCMGQRNTAKTAGFFSCAHGKGMGRNILAGNSSRVETDGNVALLFCRVSVKTHHKDQPL